MPQILAVTFTLPLPPSIYQLYATVNGRRVLTQQARYFQRRARNLIERWHAENRISDTFIATLQRGFIGLVLDFYFATPLRRDLDGGLKIAQDVICTTLGVDDRRVVSLHLTKYIDPRQPRLEVELEAIPEWNFAAVEYAYVDQSQSSS